MIRIYSKSQVKDKRVKSSGYAIILTGEFELALERLALSCRALNYPVFYNECSCDREKTNGYFIKVVKSDEQILSLGVGVGSCYGIKEQFIYDSEQNATTIYNSLKRAQSRISSYAKMELNQNDCVIDVTLTAFCQDRFEKAVMEVAQITAKFCPLVKVSEGYDAIEQDYNMVNALASLPYKVEKLILTDSFNGALDLAKGKLYCEVSAKNEEEILTVLTDAIITITTEARK